ncbi:MAG TPA: filamentous hemagglutinin N-terminal domain-containing protein [Coleofasciculaceae cyanobacterium]
MAQHTEEGCSESKPLSYVRYCLPNTDGLKKLTPSIALKKAKQKINYFLTLSFSVLLSQTQAFAQLTPDTTLGGESSIVTPGVVINNQSADRIDGGASRGANLFHSFSEFNLNTEQRVYFASPTGIENIITRVTGANPSNLLGTLGVNGSANLFLINPNGIFFGANARLDIRGSFFASTADSIKFADGNSFSATTPQNLPLLTVSVPLGLQFGATPKPVQVQGSRLEVPLGRTVGLIGGDVTLQGGIVAAPYGRIELGSVTGNSLVSLNQSGNDWRLGYEGVQNFQDIQLSDGAVISSSGEGGGDIQVWARSLKLSEESRIEALTLGSQPGGTIAINTSNSVELTGTGTYNQDILLFLSGQVTPRNLRNGLFALSYGAGAAGNVVITTPSLIARNGAFVATSTFGAGEGGDLTLNASDNVELTASALITGSGIGKSGDAGDLTVNTGRLLVQEYSVLGTSTLGSGQGGDMTVNASQSVELIGTNPIALSPGARFLTGLFSSTLGSGDSGDVRVTTPRLSVRDGAAIGASTAAQGKGGNIIVTASERAEIVGKSPDGEALSALAATAEIGSTGRGGNLSVQTGQLILQDEGRLSVRSRGGGDAGNLEVVADSIRLDNQGSIAAATTVAGEGGNIKLQTQSLQLRRNSIINAEGGERGNGGNIVIDTDTLVALENSNITANTFQGTGGSIRIDTQGLFVEPTSKITASSTLGISGVVDINTEINNVEAFMPPLPQEFLSPEQIVADSCLGRRNDKGGSFTITGTGGLPSTPYGAFTASYPVTDLQQISGSSATSHRKSPVTSEEPNTSSSVHLLQEAQGMFVTADGRVVLATVPQLQALAKAENLTCNYRVFSH